MPAQERAFRRQTAVLWAATGVDRYGQTTVGAPQEVCVRWNDVLQERRNKDGTTTTIVAQAVVDIDIALGSQMWLGTLDDWYAFGSAGANTGLCQVWGFNKTPDLKARANFREVDLMRLRDKS